MSSIICLRPITDARLEVIPCNRRDRAFALMARSQGKPALLPVSQRTAALVGSPEENDFAIGLYTRTGCSSEHTLTGIVAVRERIAAGLAAVPSSMPVERVFLIDALTIASEMLDWHPPVRTLLAATAATIIATIAHDPSYLTYVACRAPRGDQQVGGAIAAIGGRPVELPDGAGVPTLAFGAVPSSELSFLDASAAALAANIVADHLTGEVQTTLRYQLPGPGDRLCEAVLSLEFPRPLRHLRREIELVASGDVDLGWRTPAVVGNDIVFPLERAVVRG